MTRRLYVWRDGKMVEVGAEFRPTPRVQTQIITDSMPNLWHPGDGKHYDSKSAFRRATKSLGLEEVGNDRQTPKSISDAGGIKADLTEVARKLKFLE